MKLFERRSFIFVIGLSLFNISASHAGKRITYKFDLAHWTETKNVHFTSRTVEGNAEEASRKALDFCKRFSFDRVVSYSDVEIPGAADLAANGYARYFAVLDNAEPLTQAEIEYLNLRIAVPSAVTLKINGENKWVPTSEVSHPISVHYYVHDPVQGMIKKKASIPAYRLAATANPNIQGEEFSSETIMPAFKFTSIACEGEEEEVLNSGMFRDVIGAALEKLTNEIESSKLIIHSIIDECGERSKDKGYESLVAKALWASLKHEKCILSNLADSAM